jgi:hypothetical protein
LIRGRWSCRAADREGAIDNQTAVFSATSSKGDLETKHAAPVGLEQNVRLPRLAIDTEGDLSPGSFLEETIMIKRSSVAMLALCALATVLTVQASYSASLTMTSGLTLDRTTPANLIANGSFENGGPGNFWATGTTNIAYSPLPNWVSGGGALNYAQWDNTALFHNSDALPDGTHGLYFGNAFVSVSPAPTFLPDGTVTFASTPVITHITAPASSYLPDVTLQQTVGGLDVSKLYALSFWTSGESSGSSNGYPHDGIFGLDITGFPTLYLAVPHGGTGGLGPSHVYQFLLNPASAATTITFTNWGHFIDPVIVSTTEVVMDDVILNVAPVGACCIPGQICQVLSTDACVTKGGIYAGDGLPCDAQSCLPVPTESRSWGQIKASYR